MDGRTYQMRPGGGAPWRGYYLTAYGLAVKNGFEGSEREWLESLIGPQGPRGYGIESAVLNEDFTLTLKFEDGSSYTTRSLRGEVGPRGETGPQGERGEKGKTGDTGPVGPVGPRGYGITSAVLNEDYTLTLNFEDGASYTTGSIRGKQGPKGDTGNTGPQGEKGNTGDTGPQGEPGVSPTVSVSKEGGTTTVTITDAEGPHTAEIKDGEVTQEDLDAALAKKQDVLTGTAGQVVGFDAGGKAVAAEVGGTNLYTGTKDFSGDNWVSSALRTWDRESEKYKDLSVISKSPRYNGVYQNIDVKPGEVFTFSFYGKAETEQDVAVMVMSKDGNFAIITPAVTTVTLSTEWARYHVTVSVASAEGPLKLKIDKLEDNQTRYYICGLKLERGTVATDWSPAPEDLVYKWQTEGVVPHRYVVRWDKKQAKCMRMYDAANITTDTAHFAYHGSVDPDYDNPFDKLYPWSHRKLCKADKAKYKELYEAGGNVLEAITKWEDEPGFKLGPELDGMDMVYTPEFWMKQWEDGGYVYVGVADGPIYGWEHVPEMVLGRYLASQDGEGLTSRAGDIPYADTISLKGLHDAAKKDNLTLDTIQTWDAETVLMVVEYASLNCQTAIGQSVCNLFRSNDNDKPKEDKTGNEVTLPSGIKPYCIPGAILDFGTAKDRCNTARRIVESVTDAEEGYVTVTFSGEPVTYTTETFCSIHGLYNAPDEQIGSKSGYIGTDGKCNAYYRGRNCWGNCYHYLLGAYREKDTGHIWVAPDEETADELDGLNKEKCIDTGCALPNAKEGTAADGWISELHLLSEYPMAPFCKAVNGGTSGDPVGDYCWWPALNAADTICIAGAGASNGLSVGRFAANWRNASSGAWWDHAASLAFKIPRGGV